MSIKPDLDLMKFALECKCPKCRKGELFQPGLFTVDVQKKCKNCGLKLEKSDAADGPAVFLIFILGFSLVPLALALDHFFTVPLWFHALLWSVIALGVTLFSIRPLKAYIIALQYKHRPGDWK